MAKTFACQFDDTSKNFSKEIRGILVQTTQILKNNHFKNPSKEAIILVACALKIDKISLYLHYNKILSDLEQASISKLLARRLEHEPLEYLTGQVNFMGIDFMIEPPILIPRPETEVLVETLVKLAKSRNDSQTAPTIIFDIGTGSGIIGITSLKFLPNARVYASDIIDLHLAKRNAIKLSTCHSFTSAQDKSEPTCHSEPFGCHSERSEESQFLPQDKLREESRGCQSKPRKESKLKISERISFLRSDLLQSFKRKADFIVSNPPYISSSEIPSLQPEIKLFESHTALDGGEDGLFFIRELIRTSGNNLKKSGMLLLEISPEQTDTIGKEALKYFESVEFIKDFFGRTRVFLAKYPKTGTYF